ncbi:hypothetical protein AMS68_005627 [Peltaster fructicola]|uniref:Uncharacterized protein n=1 Tax=Peltaster fructicola TaxID=286661 RepID=A0A6H0Y0D9_9PEZI|nr:hypothetical protein AMS68_005627 [Peltaster fructicola]
MNTFLLNRQLGSVGAHAFATAQNERLLHALHATNISFAGRTADSARPVGNSGSSSKTVSSELAHPAGCSALAIDRWEGRYMVTAGADSSVAIYDLERLETQGHVRHPLSSVSKTSITASLGITDIKFYPFDSLAFLTTGYDHTLKLFSSETLKVSAKFDLASTVYSHATSNVASHLLVACATQHPAVRLIDLQSGASAHSLAGHSGSVLTVAWHPTNENILASGATDGTVRVWDVRRSASSLGVLDLDDSIGVAGYDGKGTGARRRERGRAHTAAVNGITWTEDGHYLASTGLDERMRVWDMTTGANTLANFGPALKNARNTILLPLLAPSHLSAAGSEVVFFPCPNEILSFDLHNGNMLQRLRVVGIKDDTVQTGGTRNLKARTTSLAWRAHHIELYSAHTDGTIRCWAPRTWEDDVADEEFKELSGEKEETESKKRKRDELEQIVRNLTGKQVIYS